MVEQSEKAEADPFDLERFVKAQEGTYHRTLTELRMARKESHWMWFIFPQIAGLGSSSTARFYAIKSRQEAQAYLGHPILGPRLLECSKALLEHQGKSASEIFDYPDDLKLRSSMTLFYSVSESDSVFARVLAQYYEGQPDERTLELLKTSSSG
jgi:uncharacterized protein (DUF1810 family)